jgi:hypothetical protein
MAIPDDKAARIQQLLQRLRTSGTYEGVAIAAEIHQVAAEKASEPDRALAINSAPEKQPEPEK